MPLNKKSFLLYCPTKYNFKKHGSCKIQTSKITVEDKYVLKEANLT